MYGDSPCQTQRVLTKLTLYLLAYLLGLLVDDVVGVGPYLGLYLHFRIVFESTHTNLGAIHKGYLTEFTIIIARALAVVFEEHHLTSLLEHECLLSRIGGLGEVARHLSLEREARCLERIHALLVVAVGRGVVGGEADGTVG